MSKAEPIAVLHLRPFGPSASVCLRALAPAWPIPTGNAISTPRVPPTALGNPAISALGNQALSALVPNLRGDGTFPPVDPRLGSALSVYPPRSDGQGPSAVDTSTFPSSGGPHVDPSLGHSAVPSIAGRPGSAMPQTRASGRSAPSAHGAPSVGPGPSQSPSIEPTSIHSPRVKPSLANNRISPRAQ
jgi:hypothetical protein